MRARRPVGLIAAVVGLIAAFATVHSAASLPMSAATTAVAGPSSCPDGIFAGTEANGIPLCVHADDGALHPALALPAALPGIPCYPGTGPHVHVYYAYKAGTASKLSAVRAQLRDLVAQTDALYNQSAHDTGGTRHVRWLMSSSCHLVITPMAVSGSTSDIAAAFRAVVASHTLGASDHAVVFLEWGFGGGVCGYGSVRTDGTAGRTNTNNHYQGLAEIANGHCREASSVAHELGHTLGAVQPSAPHRSYSNHCYDGVADVMCYDDGTIPSPMSAGRCPGDQLSTLDCGHDDYFDTSPAAGSYLATHWNVARSVLLASANPRRWDAVPNPTVRITSVRDGATFVGQGDFETQAPTTVVVSAGRGTVKRVEFYLDDTQYLPAATAAPYTGTPVQAMLDKPGWHQLYAVVRLTDGRARTSPIVRVRALPDVRLTSPDGSRTVAGVIPLTVTLPPASAGRINRVEYTVDGTVVATALASPFAASLDTATLAGPAHTFGARLLRADGTALATAADRTVSVASDGSAVALRTAAAGSTVSGTVPASVSVTGLPAGRRVTSVTFHPDFANQHVDGTAPYTFSWRTCTDSFGCSPGDTLTLNADVLLSDGSSIRLTRDFVRGATSSTVTTRIRSGARLHAGTTITVPFSVTNLPGSLYAVQVFTRKGFLGEVSATSGQRSVRMHVPSSWRGSDTLWVRLRTTAFNDGRLFSKHVAVTWTS